MKSIEWFIGAAATISLVAATACAQTPEAPATGLSDDLRAGRVTIQTFLPSAVRIVGGHDARPGEDPWQIALLRSDQWGSVLCGGSVVQAGWLVTAAHCLTPTPPLRRLVVVAGAVDLSHLPQQAYLAVDKIVLHPLWDPRLDSGGHVQRFSDDVALIHVRALSGIEPDARIAPIEIASEGMLAALNPGAELRVTGWGALWYGGRQSSTLQAATVPLADFSACERQYPGSIDETMICAGLDEGGRDACQGDSGGPLTVLMGGRSVLVGIVSFGRGCGAPASLGVYARASRLRDWITACIAAHTSASPQEWPYVRCDALPAPAQPARR
jgi:secreted trypsin-like serine protease